MRHRNRPHPNHLGRSFWARHRVPSYMFGGAFQQFVGQFGGATMRCPETGGEGRVTWFHGESYCGECGQAVDASGLLAREYDHPD